MIKKWIIRIISSLLKQFIKIVPPAVVEKNMLNIANKMEMYSNSFFSYHLRPKLAKDTTLKSNNDYRNIGIVIQGPLVLEQNFTLETVKLYKKLFANSVIVVSTWDDEKKDYVNKILKEGAFVLLNKKPENSGALNSNYQIVSTLSGLRFLETKDVGFVLKTRSDQRIYNYQSIDLFQSLIKLYPVINSKQASRIVSVNLTTLKYRPYAIGDMCMFGSLSDIINYWDIELESRTISRNELVGLTIKELTELNVAETYYCTHYLNKIGIPTPISINNSWTTYRDFFIVIDYEMIDLYWYKYDRATEYRHKYYSEHSFELFKYSNWIGHENCVKEENRINEIDGSNNNII